MVGCNDSNVGNNTTEDKNDNYNIIPSFQKCNFDAQMEFQAGDTSQSVIQMINTGLSMYEMGQNKN